MVSVDPHRSQSWTSNICARACYVNECKSGPGGEWSFILLRGAEFSRCLLGPREEEEERQRAGEEGTQRTDNLLVI